MFTLLNSQSNHAKRALDWLFQGDDVLSCRGIVWWWEKRRLAYNGLVGIVGLATLVLVIVLGSYAVKPGERIL